MTDIANQFQPRRWHDGLSTSTIIRMIYVRALAFGFLALGIYRWAALLGAVPNLEPDFYALSLQGQAVVLFFAVANLVAAVGLWLLATWGVVIWFASAAARIVLHTVFASSYTWTPIATGADCLAMIVFIVLIILESRAERREIARQRENRRNRARD